MLILYGTKEHNIDVTLTCLIKLKTADIITIPDGDLNRAAYFTDPLLGTKKSVYIINNNTSYEYDEHYIIKINIMDNSISATSSQIIDDKLQMMHSKLKINHGSLNNEVPEQKMVIRYLTGKEKVLEIGGNIGRNSLIILLF